MRLINATEMTVLELLKETLNTKDICKCERCRLDIAAIALNNLPPSYVVTTEGEVVKTVERQSKVDAIRQIENAIAIVSQNPHHK